MTIRYWHRLMIVAVTMLLLAVTGMAQQSVSVAPADKADAPNSRPVTQIFLTDEFPVGLQGTKTRWMVPPKPVPFNWSTESDGQDPTWEYAWEVTHIKFDHQQSHSEDGMDIRWTFRHDLEHTGEGIGDGEYNVEEERNEPALYMIETPVTVKVRIQVKDALGNPPGQASRANIYASAGGDGSFMSLEERPVDFDANGISIGDDGTEYVKFATNGGPVPNQFGEYTVRYKFYLNDPIIDIPGDMGPGRTVEFDELSRIDVYSVFRFPQQPWNHRFPSFDETQPWVSALAFMCYPCGCADLSDVNAIAGNAAKHLHWGHSGTSGHGMEYAHEDGHPGFSIQASHLSTHNLTQYMTKYKNGQAANKVNCTDQASALHALMQLAYTGESAALYLRGDTDETRDWFGYMNTSTFVGGVDSNHPFHEDPDYVQSAIVGTDDLWEENANGLYKRSFFDYHAAVRMTATSHMVDACFGPVIPSAGLELDDYLATYRDTSTQDEQTIQGKQVFAIGDETLIDLALSG